MKKQFKVTGFYYEELGFKFRKYLDIKTVDTDIRTPDLMVIMMNPGSSRPVDGIDNNTKESSAIPDRTQDQIMKVMLNSNLQYARILNLSDLREAKSNIFYNKIIDLENKGISHSIFDENRQEDFNQLWINNVPVIFGWGVNDHLKPLALKAMKSCNASNPYGILKANTNWAYYHPLPQIYSKQQEWVSVITQHLLSN
ncbi:MULTISPECIES: DUF1643 domain-containing protein [Flavobacteriaceae]|uniref:DUF1643 domain-containing protein n=2 Tax=Flavobacteriaceae TaxID=49546 RepID=A0A4Y8ARN8_9FLAO|nr:MULTISPECIES: DUF1643 domain-containing protein [Flavobacteriaceae]TEW73824.1 DUF1643 domain-containing protein [Gramella jeungdoensis]GGK37895.1 hypothetical protein GCM10007963_02520 [Lutibacter litoralis]